MYYFICQFDSQTTGSTRLAIFADEDIDSELRKTFRWCDSFNTLKLVYRNSLEEMLNRKIRKPLADPCFHRMNKPINLNENEITELYAILDEFKVANSCLPELW
jgi:hypothetical protein